MLNGYAFRSPDVIRMMLDRVKFAGFVIPRMDSTGKHVAAYKAALAEPVGKRVRVMLVAGCETLCNLVTQVKDFDRKSVAYIVFDSASVLAGKTCVCVVDTDDASKPVWLYSRSTPASVNASAVPGISQEDLDCLGMSPEDPEDVVKTDVMKEKVARGSAKSTFVPIKDLLTDILALPELQGNSSMAQHLLALYLSGKLVRPTERCEARKRNIASVGICDVGAYIAKDIEYIAYDRLVRLGAKHGLDFAKHEQRILPIKAMPEFAIVAKALINVERGMAIDKSCASCGANSGAVAIIARLLQPPAPRLATVYVGFPMSFPVHVLGNIRGKAQSVEFVDKQRAAAVERISVREGAYKLDALLRMCGLLSGKETVTNPQHATTSAPETNAPKVKFASGAYGHKVVAGEHYYVRYRGKRVPIQGV